MILSKRNSFEEAVAGADERNGELLRRRIEAATGWDNVAQVRCSAAVCM